MAVNVHKLGWVAERAQVMKYLFTKHLMPFRQAMPACLPAAVV